MDMEFYINVMKALSDSNRVRILLALDGCELCVCQILELLQLAPSTVSKHISILKQAKLVQSRKEGRWSFYKLSDSDRAGMGEDFISLTIKALEDSEIIKKDEIRLSKIKKINIEELCRNQRGEKCCPVMNG